MASAVGAALSEFGQAVLAGFSRSPKWMPARYFYDDLGSVLFEAITLLPEYGLTRADERLLRKHSRDVAAAVGNIALVCELGSGTGKKTRYVLESLGTFDSGLVYRPVDVSAAALAVCERELSGLALIEPVCDDWVSGLEQIAATRTDAPLLLLFLGSSIGNLDRNELPAFLSRIHAELQPGDFFLLGTDLVKNADAMLAAYDDPTGVTAAFNLNLLGRINRELGANFDLRSFAHEVRWNAHDRRIEMHLLSCRDQDVSISALDLEVHFEAGETIWTESSHKFTETELANLARQTGFEPAAIWSDREWPFAESLWRVCSPAAD